MEKTRRRFRKRNTTRLLMTAICVLVVVLVIVVAVAVFMSGGKEKIPGQETTGQETAGGSTGGQTQQSGQQEFQMVIASPEKTELRTFEEFVTFAGTYSPGGKLTVGGIEVPVAQDGSFSCNVPLNIGDNEIAVVWGDETAVYTVCRSYAVKSFSPEESASYFSGAPLRVSISVRKDSDLQVEFNGSRIEMKEDPVQIGRNLPEGFVLYTGTYTLPRSTAEEKNLGAISYTVSSDGYTETYTSGDIICRKTPEPLSSDPSVTPDYGDYIDVGSGWIAEIILYDAETFNGTTLDDYSHPGRNYLPEGTVDYCDPDIITTKTDFYRLLRCGRRVYVSKFNTPEGRIQVTQCYQGTLPDHNEIGVSSIAVEGNHTVLTLDVLWKAPFFFKAYPQEYMNASNRDYRVTEQTCEYIDITFCYATVFEGEVTFPEDNPLFSSAELIRNESDCVLRLHLKKTGVFSGWDASYNEKGQLCFRFLNPTKAAAADNEYGADLTGITILLDVGHGGKDGGAVSKDGNYLEEADLNLKLAKVLKTELEKTGATVILNRYDDTQMNAAERSLYLRQVGPDLCIALHHNSLDLTGYSGGEYGYYYPFSQKAAALIYQESSNSGVYENCDLYWHYYYLGRHSYSPVVLTENGYLSNAKDLATCVDPQLLREKAQATARGAARYFLTIDE